MARPCPCSTTRSVCSGRDVTRCRFPGNFVSEATHGNHAPAYLFSRVVTRISPSVSPRRSQCSESPWQRQSRPGLSSNLSALFLQPFLHASLQRPTPYKPRRSRYYPRTNCVSSPHRPYVSPGLRESIRSSSMSTMR